LKRVDYRDVLKDISIERISQDAQRIAEKYGYLPYMVERYIEMLGVEETLELLKAFENFTKRYALLCNSLRIECGALEEKLSRLGFELKRIDWCSECLEVVNVPKSPSVGSTHEYLKGFYYVYRDKSSLVPVSLAKPGQGIVLDMCAAPGGKTAHIVVSMRSRGVVIANDKSYSRVITLMSNMYRMGFANVAVINEDGRDIPKIFGSIFDYVLLDAPCSAEGAIMFDPGRKTRTRIEDLARLVAREIELLQAAILSAKPGGLIVYVTCSIAPEEDEYVVTKAAEILEGLVEFVEPESNRWSWGLREFRNLRFHSGTRKCVRIWPHKHGMEGFFVCILRRTA